MNDTFSAYPYNAYRPLKTSFRDYRCFYGRPGFAVDTNKGALISASSLQDAAEKCRRLYPRDSYHPYHDKILVVSVSTGEAAVFRVETKTTTTTQFIKE